MFRNCAHRRALLRSIGVFAVLGSLSFARAGAQETDAQAPVATTETLHVSSQLVLLDASVTNRKTGQVITGLTSQDFVLTEDGEAQNVSSLSQNTLPLSVLLLFDATDTVRPVLFPLALGARRFLTHLHEDDEVAVATFSTHVTLLQRFTTDRPSVIFALGDASGVVDKDKATFIYEDVFEATELAQRSHAKDSRKVEVWLTDGSANYEDTAMMKAHGDGAPIVLHTQAEAADGLGRSGVVVSALIETSTLTAAERRHPEHGRFGDIEHFANLTGGPVQYAAEADVVDKFAALLDALRARYTLGYKPSRSKPAGTLCKLQLSLSPAYFAQHPELRLKDILVRTRQSYTR